MRVRHHIVLVGLLLTACTLSLPDDVTTTSSTTSSTTTTDGVGQSETGPPDPSDPTDPTTTTLTPTTTTADPGSTTSITVSTSTTFEPDESSGTHGNFIVETDVPPIGLRCDPFAQDCPETHKCTWWNDGDGSGQLSATRCVEIVADPVAVGEPCHAEGNGFSGFDDCGLGAMCWHLDQNNDGTCIALCGGDPREPTCAPDHECTLNADGIGLCLEVCDPLAQDCPAGDVCLPDIDTFLCIIDLSGDEGQLHDPCEFTNVCDPGLLCSPPAAAVECDPAFFGCCESICDLAQPDTCPGAGQVCIPVLDPSPPEFANVGVCTVPP